VQVPTLAAEREVEAAVGAAALDHQPQRDRSPQRPTEVALAEPGEAQRQLAALAEAVVGELDDRGDDLLRRRQASAG
jgi:hypothetical protein